MIRKFSTKLEFWHVLEYYVKNEAFYRYTSAWYNAAFFILLYWFPLSSVLHQAKIDEDEKR